MEIIHVLRKYNPAEWGGTETAMQNLFDGLRHHAVQSVMYCPRVEKNNAVDPIAQAGYPVKFFNACVPIWGISRQQKNDLIANGGNLFSFDLMGSLRRERGAKVIHAHTLGRLGAIAQTVARHRKLPFVVTVHGGAMDLPAAMRKTLSTPTGGWEWGKVFGGILKSRQLFQRADAIVTCNGREAELLGQNFPGKRIVVQSHSVRTELYQRDYRELARREFPQIQGKQVLLSLGRIDPVKNQGWLLDQAPEMFRRHPQALLVLVGACTDQAYGEMVKRKIREAGLEDRVLLTGGLPPADPRLVGLFQNSRALILPSVSETFGLVILEAWAAGTTVMSSRTSGPSSLIQHRENGWLFDLENPRSFLECVDEALGKPELTAQFAEAGRRVIAAKHDANVLAGRMRDLYAELTQEKYALRHSAGR